MADSPVIEMMEAELAKKKDEVVALEQALSVLRGNTITARELMYLPKSREFEHIGTTEAAKRLIKEQGPLGTRAIADLALDRGIKTRSKNYVATVYATLEQNGSAFTRNKDGNWMLVEEKD